MTAVLATTLAGLRAARAGLPSPVVLVPTMGALHAGHQALLRRGRQLAGPGGALAVSIFVNPLQFGPAEDLDRYPRTLPRDLELCEAEGAALVFAPPADEMYPARQLVRVDPGPLGEILEGTSRPGFFGGVLTVVAKLFNLVRPDVAVFGDKDAQQLAMVRSLVADLNLPVEIAGVPTVRDPDGLAVSSRHAYLSPAERATALAISRALKAAAAARGAEAALAAARAELDSAASADPPLRLDYLALVDPETFAGTLADHAGPARLLIAAWVGHTRLIDNALLDLGGPR